MDEEESPSGTVVSRSIVANSNGTEYPLKIYLPPGLAAIRHTAPVIYLLDGDSRIAMYLPHAQFPVRAMNVVIRSGNDPATLTAAARQALRAVDPELPMFRVRTMEARVGESLARRRFLMVLLALFAGVALGLAAIGTYGVLAYLVSQGRRELAIRMALGATTGDILRLVAGHGMAIAAAGVAAGLLGALLAARLLDTVLFEVSATDPLTFAGVALALAVIALLASIAPAWRAARIDPVAALGAD